MPDDTTTVGHELSDISSTVRHDSTWTWYLCPLCCRVAEWYEELRDPPTTKAIATLVFNNARMKD